MANPEAPWLDELLRGASVDYPPTPDLAATVLEWLPAHTPARHPGVHAARVIAGGIAFALVAIVALVAIPTTREGIAGFLGLRVEGEHIEVLPTPSGGVSPTPLPSPPVLESIAERVTLAEAEEGAGFEPLLPTGFEPSAAYLLDYLRFPVIVLRFENFDLWQAEPGGFVGKGIVIDGTVLEDTMVGDEPAYWITGGPRLVTFRNPDGSEIAGSQRTVTANTLVWATADRYYRIEGDLTIEQALVVAATLP